MIPDLDFKLFGTWLSLLEITSFFPLNMTDGSWDVLKTDVEQTDVKKNGLCCDFGLRAFRIEAMEAEERQRAKITPIALTDVLRRHIKTGGKSYIRYDDNPILKKAKLDVERVKIHKEIVKDLRNLKPHVH